ncbi:MAG: cupin domain-containing protein [Alphaproteobacteria bacterium]
MTAAARKTAVIGTIVNRLTADANQPADLEPWPAFPPENVVSGNPNGHKGKLLFRSPDGLYSVGVWECPPARFIEPYPGSEFGHVLKGRARLKDLASGQVQELKAGDHFFIEFNRTIEWEVIETFRKVYTMYEAEWAEDRFY